MGHETKRNLIIGTIHGYNRPMKRIEEDGRRHYGFTANDVRIGRESLFYFEEETLHNGTRQVSRR